MPLTSYLHQPEQLDAATLDELTALLNRYPYFQAARLLLLRGLYQQQSERFGAELRRAALFVPDRARLFELIEGDKFRLETDLPSAPADEIPKTDSTTDRTQSLIDTFLRHQPETPKSHRPRPVDATTDYIGYLLQMDDATLPPLDQPAEDSENADDPVEFPEPASSSVSSVTPENSEPVPAVADDEDLIPLGLEESDEKAPSEAFFTETLARIYIKQGKYAKAIEIIRRLNLNYPKKSRYFADQIRFLEKLLINERSK